MLERTPILNSLHDLWYGLDHRARNDFIAYASEDIRQDIGLANGSADIRFRQFPKPKTSDLEHLRAVIEIWSLATPEERLQFALDTAGYRLQLIAEAAQEFHQLKPDEEG